MTLIDFILNLAGLLLWLNWRSLKFDPLVGAKPASLVGTLRRTEPFRWKTWHFLAAIAVLLLIRSLFYWQIGSAVNWTPKLPLGAIAISFRSDFFGRMVLFSFLSFGLTLTVLYLWLLLLSLVNDRVTDATSLQKLVQLHLGRIDRWPRTFKLLLPLLVTGVLWFFLSLLLARLQIIPPAVSVYHRLEQTVVVGLSAYLTWRYLIGALLGLYVLSNYIYLGSHTFWTFIGTTAKNLLLPLNWIPLRLGKVDFAPIVEIALVFLFAELAEHGLTVFYQRLPI